jgi:hypothetical protein
LLAFAFEETRASLIAVSNPVVGADQRGRCVVPIRAHAFDYGVSLAAIYSIALCRQHRRGVVTGDPCRAPLHRRDRNQECRRFLKRSQARNAAIERVEGFSAQAASNDRVANRSMKSCRNTRRTLLAR